MDTWISSGQINLTEGRLNELVQHVERISSESPENSKKYAPLSQRFSWLLSQKKD